MNKVPTAFALMLLFCFSNFAESKSTLTETFTEGQLSGEAGLYYEVTDFKRSSQESVNNESFANLYTQIKYETAKWNNLQIGAQLFAAQDIYDDNGSNNNKGYDQDFERDAQVSFSEIYLKYWFSDKSYILAGRYNHKKITHIDDSHSQGAYISYNDIENLKFTAGFMTHFAELDYDDFEDFGRKNDSQDLADHSYGESANVLFYIDAKYQISKELKANSYIYYQDNYAAVYGSDFDYSREISETITAGLKTSAYLVDDQRTEEANNQNAFVAHIRPWITISDLKLEVGYTHFGKGLFKPKWFGDYLTGFDQVTEYNSAGVTDEDTMRVVQASATYKFKKLYARYGIIKWDNDADNGADALEQELIFGYKVCKSTDLALRLLDVDHGSDSRREGLSYQKIEARLRYKF